MNISYAGVLHITISSKWLENAAN